MTFTAHLQGTVNAAGRLTVPFGPPGNQIYDVRQVTLEMTTAPAGCTAEIRQMGSLIAPSYSARRAAASEPPPITLQGGETLTVEWFNATPNDIGRVTIVYDRKTYY